MSVYRFERVSEEKYEDLLYIMKAAFGTCYDVAYYKSKFNTDYLGVKHLGFLAYDEKDEPAAFYGVFPYMMEYKGKKILGAQSGDTMTHPAHKGKSLFKTLGKMTNELAKQNGIQLMFGLPNQFSYHGLVKSLQWTHVDDMINYKLKIFTFPLSALCKRLPFLLSIYNRYVEFVVKGKKERASFFKSSAVSDEFGGVYRDEAFYNYKKFYNNHLIQLGNHNVWIKIDGSLFIGDIEYKEGADIKQLINDIKKLACVLGCIEVVFPLCAGTKWDLRLKSVLPQSKGLALCLIDLQSGLPLDKFRFTAADFDTF